MKKTIKETLPVNLDVDVNIDELLEYGEKYDSITIDVHAVDGYYEIELIGSRLETDKEYQTRLKKEELEKQKKIERDLKLLAQLKEQYEKE